MPILETQRLILREFVPNDWEALNVFLSDSTVTRYTHFASWNEEKRRAWFESLVKRASNPYRDKYDWAITLKSERALVGWLIIGRSPDSPEENRMQECGCGYALDRPYWGKGYMPEALRASFAYAFSVLGTTRIYAESQLENTASTRVMQKVGMDYEGIFSEDDSAGNPVKHYRYSMTREQSERKLTVPS